MGFLDWLRGTNNRPVEDHPISSGYGFFFGGTTSGRPVTKRSAMQMTAEPGDDQLRVPGNADDPPAVVGQRLRPSARERAG